MSYLSVRELQKYYGHRVVLNRVDLQVYKGELVTLLGPSGCGKTTLLRAIAGLISIDGGSINLDDIEISGLTPRQRQLGMVFQSYALFPHLTVSENITFGLMIKRVPAAERNRRVQAMIKLVGLEGKEKQLPYQLSGGEQQRVALSRSLVVKPKMLLLDEPLSALDASLRKTLQLELRRIQQSTGITMMLVTHDQEEALSISDKIFVMEGGQVVQAGRPEEIYTNPGNAFVAGFIGSYNIITARQAEQILGLYSKETSCYAIRPEVIKMQPSTQDMLSSGNEWCYLSGMITSVSVKGSVLRYQVQVEGLVLQVDCLNTSEQQWALPDREVRLGILRQDCVVLEQGDSFEVNYNADKMVM